MKAIVTGFAGTVGGAFTRYLLKEGWEVVGIDNNEWAVACFPNHKNLTKVLGDFAEYADECNLLVHCAAYKHVDLIEQNPDGAWQNNVERTEAMLYNITINNGNTCGLERSRPVLQQPEIPEHNDRHYCGYLFISTDKSVEPCSVYGETKKEGERLFREAKGVIARMGNILGSNGSVIPKWAQALEQGKPLEITDLNMTRWVIPADEAVAKIMGLLPRAKPGQVIVPEMGEAVCLGDMVKDFLKKNKKPRDYPLVTIGIRPGERLAEKLTWDHEKAVYTSELGTIYKQETV